jgi:hypothetical protein
MREFWHGTGYCPAAVLAKSQTWCRVNPAAWGCTPSVWSNGIAIACAASRQPADSSSLTPSSRARSAYTLTASAAASRFRRAIRFV